MAQSATPRRILRFGSFEVDLASGELRRRGLKISLQDQPFRLLALLLDRAGEVVTRAELLESVWGTRYAGVEHSIEQAAHEIRSALQEPGWIFTVRGIGYKFVIKG